MIIKPFIQNYMSILTNPNRWSMTIQQPHMMSFNRPWHHDPRSLIGITIVVLAGIGAWGPRNPMSSREFMGIHVTCAQLQRAKGAENILFFKNTFWSCFSPAKFPTLFVDDHLPMESSSHHKNWLHQPFFCSEKREMTKI